MSNSTPLTLWDYFQALEQEVRLERKLVIIRSNIASGLRMSERTVTDTQQTLQDARKHTDAVFAALDTDSQQYVSQRVASFTV